MAWWLQLKFLSKNRTDKDLFILKQTARMSFTNENAFCRSSTIIQYEKRCCRCDAMFSVSMTRHLQNILICFFIAFTVCHRVVYMDLNAQRKKTIASRAHGVRPLWGSKKEIISLRSRLPFMLTGVGCPVPATKKIVFIT